MSDKRYYWLRLYDDFFDSLRIKKLRRMAGGDTYTIIYLKMQLKAMKTGGVLTFTGIESDFADELALDIDESADDVRVTLAFLQSCGLVECSDNVNFFLPYAVANTGSETASTQRSRDCRARKALQCNINATELQRECNVEKDTIDIVIDRDRERDIDRGGTGEEDTPSPSSATKPDKPVKHKYGEYSNVLLTDEELAKLKAEFPHDWSKRIENLSAYMASTGKTYKSHLATIRNWRRMEKEKGIGEAPKSKNRSFTDDNITEYERWGAQVIRNSAR